ncbi:phenylacetic acid degradation protein PaaY [Entomomonas asaccharolytica]|uniref:Phenylacetic acid degradation protein PaaY n=1 Tax=Entomomonas asaccharolytica TaxID=2785331 RepID=A0A974NG40_9GAMM|nr:phenylacetic acid degradation protein PaaY [Entomomonas asaccharolytica]QQP86145.1 phenylacetic acid degradation protein PaaY [Entomomonas asaccharolytica]
MTCYRYQNLIPVIHPTAYVHPTAVLIGDVIIEAGCYIGPLACLRGDFGRLIVQEGSNFQDTCVMHGFPGSETIVGKNGHIGHGAILHGCILEEDCLVGMNAVVMDGAHIAAHCIIAATSFVKAGFSCQEKSMIMGTPAKVKRKLTDQEITWKQRGTKEYQELAKRCLTNIEICEPLSAIEENRPLTAEDPLLKPKFLS